jgi:hypothetical protein
VRLGAWPGIWLSLNAPDWDRQEQVAAVRGLLDRHPEAHAPFLINWLDEASGA